MSYYDSTAAHAAAEDGIERAAANASEEDKALAYRAILDLAVRQPTLTSEDVWTYLHEHLGALHINPSRGHFLGPVLRTVWKDGYIELAQGRVAPSKRPANHKRIMRVWESQVYARHAAPPTSEVDAVALLAEIIPPSTINSVADLVSPPCGWPAWEARARALALPPVEPKAACVCLFPPSRPTCSACGGTVP